MGVQVFLDTNTFLSFYHFTPDDLDELTKLAVALQHGRLTLLLPEQVEHEFYRNRESKIAESIKKLDEQKFAAQIPQVFKAYDEFSVLQKAMASADKAKQALLNQLRAQATEGTLKADIVIKKIFDSSQRVPFNPHALARARERMDRGDPPGKDRSYGDAIIWELLLISATDAMCLNFISADKDWQSPLNSEEFSLFLAGEWSVKKTAEVHFFKRLTPFLSGYFPDINLVTEQKKDELVQALVASGSFAETRTLLRRLSGFDDFTLEQLKSIADAVSNNKQVYWIANDADIARYLKKVLLNRLERLDQSTQENVQFAMAQDVDDIKF